MEHISEIYFAIYGNSSCIKMNSGHILTSLECIENNIIFEVSTIIRKPCFSPKYCCVALIPISDYKVIPELIHLYDIEKVTVHVLSENTSASAPRTPKAILIFTYMTNKKCTVKIVFLSILLFCTVNKEFH